MKKYLYLVLLTCAAATGGLQAQDIYSLSPIVLPQVPPAYSVGSVVMINDSRSNTSWSLNPFHKDEKHNVPRIDGHGGPESTTYQTYVFNIHFKN